MFDPVRNVVENYLLQIRKRPKNSRREFFPSSDWKDKNNWKHYSHVARNGDVVEAVYLSTPDPRLREEIILHHFLIQFSEIFENELDFEVVLRDDPWDFRIRSEILGEFNVEVTSFSNNQQWFKRFKAEEEFRYWTNFPRIQWRKLVKLSKLFPQLIDTHTIKKNNHNPDDIIENPIFSDDPPFFLSHNTQSVEPLIESLLRAISSKANKKHNEKHNTILILDDRTTTTSNDDFVEALEVIEDLIRDTEFPEIWIYTGYYSDDDGENAEFSFKPLKLNADTLEKLKAIDNPGVTITIE